MTDSATARRVALTRHADSRAQGVSAAAVSVRRASSARLRLRYWLIADPAWIVWPEVAGTVLRLDNLWRSTCCELFIRSAGAGTGAYREWNFSPAGHWQAYDFSGRRAGQRTADVALPAMDLGIPHARSAPALMEWMLTAEIDVPEVPLELGVALVAADRQGRLDYWALAHGTGAPDFHDPDSWVARV